MSTREQRGVNASERRRAEDGETSIRPSAVWVATEHEAEARVAIREAVAAAAAPYLHPKRRP